MVSPTELIEGYRLAVERLRKRYRKLSWLQRKSHTAGAETSRVRIAWGQLALHRVVPEFELWPRASEEELAARMETVRPWVEARMEYGFTWVKPRMASELLDKVINGKLTATQAVKEEVDRG